MDSPAWSSTIILVHGIDGHEFKTWSDEREKPWYEHLSDSVPGLSVVSLSLPYKHRRATEEELIEHLSQEVILHLRRSGVLNRHYIIVAHSLGGILTKRILADTFNYDENRYFALRRINLKGIAFLGVPHSGSPWAKYRIARVLSPVRSTSSRDLMVASRFLSEIDQRFSAASANLSADILCVHETLAPKASSIAPYFPSFLRDFRLTRFGPVVPPAYSTINMPMVENFDAHADHFELPKFNFEGGTKIVDHLRDMIVGRRQLSGALLAREKYGLLQ